MVKSDNITIHMRTCRLWLVPDMWHRFCPVGKWAVLIGQTLLLIKWQHFLSIFCGWVCGGPVTEDTACSLLASPISRITARAVWRRRGPQCLKVVETGQTHTLSKIKKQMKHHVMMINMLCPAAWIYRLDTHAPDWTHLPQTTGGSLTPYIPLWTIKRQPRRGRRGLWSSCFVVCSHYI